MKIPTEGAAGNTFRIPALTFDVYFNVYRVGLANFIPSLHYLLQLVKVCGTL